LDQLAAALAERYRPERELGSGGTATVYLAHDQRHDRKVAIKVLHPALAASLGTERFLREIEIAARLVHPHILSLLDSGETQGSLYFVMPYAPGDSLRARLRREGELPVEEALRILREVLDALRYAHTAGIVHRDIKPENVLFVDGHAQVADFGIAKALHEATGRSPLTATGLALGTPAYMAPEQAAADPHLDHRADLYAVGVLAYEMLTGVPPFAGDSPQQLISAHLTRPVERPERLRPSVPPAASALVMRCLEKRPADRWQSADELLRQIDALLAGVVTTGAGIWVERELVAGTFRIGEDLCRRLDRASFDPRMIGDGLHYLDNQVPSEVLIFHLTHCGVDAEDYAPFLRATRHRCVGVTLFGFEPDRRHRFPLAVDDHLLLIRELLRDLVARTHPRVVIAAGFSSGGDLALRLAAARSEPVVQLDACLTLGSNLALETCFVTRLLAQVQSGADSDLLPALHSVGNAAETVDDWLNLTQYFIRIVRQFRGDMAGLRTLADGIVGPYQAAGPLAPFVGWYRDATAQGRRLRCVFEDSPMYRALVRELPLRNLDHRILGDRYQEESIVIDPDTTHFDLADPARVERHLDWLVARLRREA